MVQLSLLQNCRRNMAFEARSPVALALLPKLVGFPDATRVDFAAAATLGYFLVLLDVGYVTKRINCSTLSARMPNIKWQSTLA